MIHNGKSGLQIMLQQKKCQVNSIDDKLEVSRRARIGKGREGLHSCTCLRGAADAAKTGKPLSQEKLQEVRIG
eukprot:1149324-Pelagomonas_calceolata.AAC.1